MLECNKWDLLQLFDFISSPTYISTGQRWSYLSCYERLRDTIFSSKHELLQVALPPVWYLLTDLLGIKIPRNSSECPNHKMNNVIYFPDLICQVFLPCLLVYQYVIISSIGIISIIVFVI